MARLQINSYYMTKEQAQLVASEDKTYIAMAHPDRHGNAFNGFKADMTTWGVWCNASDHWVFVESIVTP